MNARDYVYGAIYPQTGDPQAGITRFDEFKVTGFNRLFGFILAMLLSLTLVYQPG
jgi:hypothetical protein